MSAKRNSSIFEIGYSKNSRVHRVAGSFHIPQGKESTLINYYYYISLKSRLSRLSRLSIVIKGVCGKPTCSRVAGCNHTLLGRRTKTDATGVPPPTKRFAPGQADQDGPATWHPR